MLSDQILFPLPNVTDGQRMASRRFRRPAARGDAIESWPQSLCAASFHYTRIYNNHSAAAGKTARQAARRDPERIMASMENKA
jgi:hypothetical protein